MNQNFEKLKQQITSIANNEKYDANIYRSDLPLAMFYKKLCDVQLKAVLDFNKVSFTSITDGVSLYNKAIESNSDAIINYMKDNYEYFIPDLYSLFAKQALSSEGFLEEPPVSFFASDELSSQFQEILTEVACVKRENDDESLFKSEDIAPILEANFNEFSDVDLGNLFEEVCLTFLNEKGHCENMPSTDTICDLISRLVSLDIKNKHSFSAYDPTSGFGFLLSRLSVSKNNGVTPNIKYVGQEINKDVSFLTFMNLCMHGVNPKNIAIKNSDTLGDDLLGDEKFNVIVSEPSFAMKWKPSVNFENDLRFKILSAIPSSRSSEYAFIAHAIHHLDENGTLAMVLPPGILFRAGSDGLIRKSLVDLGFVYAVIGLPSASIYGTSISPCIVVFKKHNPNKDILFIDASQNYKKLKFKNVLEEDVLNKIVEVYSSRLTEKGFSKLAKYEEIKRKEYQLHISMYVNEVPCFKNECTLKDIIKDIHMGALTLSTSNLNESVSATPTNVLFLDAKNIQNGDIQDNLFHLVEDHKDLNNSLSQKGDLIISRCASPIKVSVNTRDERIAVSRNMYSITLDTSRANPLYVSAFLNSNLGSNILEMNATGITIKQLNRKAIENIKIPLPSLEEQERLLDKTEQLKAELKALKEKAQALSNSIANAFDSEVES